MSNMQRMYISVLGSLFIVACSAGTDSSQQFQSGSACSSEQAGYKTCGKTADGADAELRCEKIGLDFLWKANTTCPFGCEKAECLGPPGWIPKDATGDTPKPTDILADAADAPEIAPVDASIEPDLGCLPGETTCLGPMTSGTCNDQSEYEPAPCPDGQGCEGGYCTETICTPGEPKGECFDAVSFFVCSESGTKWVTDACPDGLKCYAGDCNDWTCNPGDKICKGMTAIQECQETTPGKYEWVQTETCAGGLCENGACVSACEVNIKQNTYLGCNYWAVDLDNIEGGKLEAVGLVVSTPATSDVTHVTIVDTQTGQKLTSNQLGGASLEIQPGQLQIYTLPTFHDIDGSGHTNNSFRIETTQPVTVHQFNPLVGDSVFTNDASLLLPDNVGGEEYLVMSWKLRTWVQSLRGFVTVIATQEGTTNVQVTAAAGVIAGPGVPSMVKGQTSAFALQQGDVLNLEVAGNEGDDLTGTRVASDQKINVFGGHECANIHVSYERCDHIEQQLFPVQAWGTEYVGDPFVERTATHVDTWRVLAGEDNITVTLNPPIAGPFTLSKGQWAEFDTAEVFVANGTGRFLLGHYLQSCNYPGYEVFCSDTGGQLGIGDPAFTLAVPTSQYLNSYIFLTPAGYTEDYVNIVAAQDTVVILDDSEVTSPTIPVSGGYVLYRHPVTAGVHTITANGEVGLTAYGYGCHVSYAYPGGLKLEVF
jgi:hypothetical protein